MPIFPQELFKDFEKFLGTQTDEQLAQALIQTKLAQQQSAMQLQFLAQQQQQGFRMKEHGKPNVTPLGSAVNSITGKEVKLFRCRLPECDQYYTDTDAHENFCPTHWMNLQTWLSPRGGTA